jgi:dienelactone hydrolase
MLDGYERDTFTAEGTTREVLRAGSGPAVIVIHEVPGVTPQVADFGRRVAAVGCTAVLPSLLGTPGRPMSMPYVIRSVVPACVSREFATWATGRTSPVTTWLRALARHEHARCGGPGVGAVGMCLTGGFALAMSVDPTVVAPVLSQPSLPFGLTKRHRADVGVSTEDLAVVVRRARDEDLCVVGLRFSEDELSPPERFQTLRRVLGDAFVAVEIDSSPGNPHGIGSGAHSVLTEELRDEPGHPTHDALQVVLEHLRSRLLGPPGAA